MDYNIPVNKDTVYIAIIKILNFKLKLTDLEIKILATLLQHNKIVINTETRAFIRKTLNTSKFTTNNYMVNLKNKGIFIESNKDELRISPDIVEIAKHRDLNFKLVDTSN